MNKFIARKCSFTVHRRNRCRNIDGLKSAISGLSGTGLPPHQAEALQIVSEDDSGTLLIHATVPSGEYHHIMIVIDLAQTLVLKASSPEKKEIAVAQAQALVQWLKSFHLPLQIRKSKLEHVTIHNPERGILQIKWQEDKGAINIQIDWEKIIESALKRVVAEDLGNLNAVELLSTIPEVDSERRGRSDLQSMRKKWSVEVVFDTETGHVFLVGDTKKLEKKCFPIRNLLRHYHWRLSGMDVSFQK